LQLETKNIEGKQLQVLTLKAPFREKRILGGGGRGTKKTTLQKKMEGKWWVSRQKREGENEQQVRSGIKSLRPIRTV